jgi:DNA-binding beta-propeller fold protein YncE
VPVSYLHDIYVVDVVWGHLLEGNFKEVGGVAFEPEAEELYVTDTKNGLIGIYDPEGVPRFAFGGTEWLVDPSVVQATADGSIYVLDSDSVAVKAYNYRGEPLGPVVFSAPPGSPPLERIATFALGPDRSWVVADREHPRVLVYGPDLELRHVLPREDDVGSFDLVTALSVSADGLVAVIDHRATPVQVFDKNGYFVSGFGSRDIGVENFSAPRAVAFDEDGYLYVVDMLRHNVKVFDIEGRFQHVFGGWSSPETRGRGPGEMLYPTGIAIAPGGFVYVSERYGNRVQLFERRPRTQPTPKEGGRERQ